MMAKKNLTIMVVVAIVVAVGAIVGGVILHGNTARDKSSGDSAGTKKKTSTEIHAHDFTAQYTAAEDTHQAFCACGEAAEAEPHTYQDRKCSLCGSMQHSEGLEYIVYEKHCVLSGVGTCTDAVVVIPAYHQGLPVQTVWESAFAKSDHITDLYIPETVTAIEQKAFADCVSLKNVYFSEGLQRLGSLAFTGCTSLEEVVLPDSLEQMGHAVFSQCSTLVSAKLPEKLEELQRGVFANCRSLTTVEIPVSMKSIGDRAFLNCVALTEIRYGGTMEQWAAIEKRYEYVSDYDFTKWHTDTGEFTVFCTDGDLPKSEAD